MLSVLVMALAAAGLYLVALTPTYEAKVRLMPPRSESLYFSRPADPLATFDSLALYNQFYTELQSGKKWSAFVADARSRLDTNIGGSVSAKAFTKPGRGKDVSIESLELIYKAPATHAHADVLRRFLAFSVDLFNADLIRSVQERVAREKENIAADIVLLRKKAELERADEIERLKRDIALAESLDITKYMLLCPDDSEKNDGSVIATSQTVPNYMRGSIALRAELDSLRNRESDDAYIVDLRKEEIERERLDGLLISAEGVLPFAQDGEISVSGRPVGPDKKLVILLAVALGLMLGALAAFLAEGFAKSKASRRMDQPTDVD